MGYAFLPIVINWDLQLIYGTLAVIVKYVN